MSQDEHHRALGDSPEGRRLRRGPAVAFRTRTEWTAEEEEVLRGIDCAVDQAALKSKEEGRRPRSRLDHMAELWQQRFPTSTRSSRSLLHKLTRMKSKNVDKAQGPPSGDQPQGPSTPQGREAGDLTERDTFMLRSGRRVARTPAISRRPGNRGDRRHVRKLDLCPSGTEEETSESRTPQPEAEAPADAEALEEQGSGVREVGQRDPRTGGELDTGRPAPDPSSGGRQTPEPPTTGSLDSEEGSVERDGGREGPQAPTNPPEPTDPDRAYFLECLNAARKWDSRRAVGKKGQAIDMPRLRIAEVLFTEHYNAEGRSLEGLNEGVYALALFVTREHRGGLPKATEPTVPAKSQKRVVKRHGSKAASEVARLRRNLSLIADELRRIRTSAKASRRQKANCRYLRRCVVRGALNRDSLLRAREGLLQRLKVRAAQARDQARRDRYVRQNVAFKVNGIGTLDRTQAKEKTPEASQPTPNIRDCYKFWKGIVGVRGHYDPEDVDVADWTRTVQAKLGDGEAPPEAECTVSDDEWKALTSKLKAWKAPGPDGIRNIWWKISPVCNRALRESVTVLANGGNIPDWMTQGATTLIYKQSGPRSDPSKYRPIACLNTMYKVLTKIMADRLTQMLIEQDLLPQQQRALRRGGRGTFDCLMADTLIALDAKRLRKNLAVAWLDFTKAYDRVPHKLVLDSLETVGAPRWIRDTVARIIPKWGSRLVIREGKTLVKSDLLHYKRGLLQGDSLSPILFCLAFAPLSHAIDRCNLAYKCGSRWAISHNGFMDDIKIYTRTERNLDTVLGTAQRVVKALGGELNAAKCGRAVLNRGKPRPAQQGGNAGGMPEYCEGDLYKYLGIRQLFGTDAATLKSELEQRFCSQVSKIWKSDLNLSNKSKAYNHSCVGLLRYFFIGYRWRKADLVKLERKARKIMRRHRSWYRSQAIERMFLQKADGGLGLIPLEVAQDQFAVSLAGYLTESSDPFVTATCEGMRYAEQRFKWRSVLKTAREVRDVYGQPQECPARTASHQVLKVKRQQLKDALLAKPVHGRFQREVGPLAYEWMRTGNLRSETAALIMNAQDGTTMTRCHRARICQHTVDPQCRLCKKGPETIQHILIGCEHSQWSTYKTRHDDVARTVLRTVLREVEGLSPQEAAACGKHFDGKIVKTQWDPVVPTNRDVQHRRPDLIVTDKKNSVVYVIEIAVSSDAHVHARALEKGRKYQQLAADLAATHRGHRVVVVPIVVGVLGNVTAVRDKAKLLARLLPDAEVLLREVQRSAIFGAAMTIKRHLGQS